MSFSKKSKNIVFILLFLFIGSYVVLTYVYKPHKSLEEREVQFSGAITVFAKKVAANPSSWHDVVVEITGKVTSIEAHGFTIHDTAFFQLENTSDLANIQKEKNVKIKARMIGFDDLLEVLKFDQAKISK